MGLSRIALNLLKILSHSSFFVQFKDGKYIYFFKESIIIIRKKTGLARAYVKCAMNISIPFLDNNSYTNDDSSPYSCNGVIRNPVRNIKLFIFFDMNNG